MAALDPLFVPGGVSPRDARIALGGLLASQGAGLDIRTGILSGYTVTGTSATGPMQVSVAAGHHVAMRSTSDGPEVGANDGATTVDIPAAPASNARIDLVWVRATDTERDGSTAAEIGVTATGAVSATPTGPYGDVPAGALVLAEVRVAAGAVRTTDPQVTITMVAKRTVARGGILPVANAADSPVASEGAYRDRADTDTLERHNGTSWGPGLKLAAAMEILGRGSAVSGAPPAVGAGKFYFQGGTNVGTTSFGGDLSIMFPTPFPNGLLVPLFSPGDIANMAGRALTRRHAVTPNDRTGFTVSLLAADGSAVTSALIRVDWGAIGW